MAGSDRGKLGKAFGLVLAGLLALGGLSLAGLYSYREFYEPAEQDQSIQEYQPARDATEPPAPGQGQPRSQTYDPHCEQPQSHDDADLCAQWAAVRTVAETNRLTRVALRLGYVGFWVAFIGGIFGLIGTALIWLAWRETKAANAIAEHGQRPWLQFEDIKVRQSGQVAPGGYSIITEVSLTIRNSGAAPALNVRRGARTFKPGGIDQIASTNAIAKQHAEAREVVGDIPPGGVFHVSFKEGVKFEVPDPAVQPQLWLTGMMLWIQYCGSFDGQEHETRQFYYVGDGRHGGASGFYAAELIASTLHGQDGLRCALKPIRVGIMT